MRTPSHSSARAAAPLLLLLLAFPGYQLVTVLREAVDAARPLRQMGLPAPDAAADRAYQTMAAALPSTGPIGFVRTPAGDAAAVDHDLMFLQYSLAPRQIIPSLAPDVVLVHGDMATLTATLREQSLEVTHDLGGEWHVLRRTRP